MRTLPILLALLVSPAIAAETNGVARYRVEYLNCYLVGLYAVADSESNLPLSWSSVVSRPYGHGAVPDLERMVKKWNARGAHPGDEPRLEIALRRKGLFAFPASAGPAPRSGTAENQK